MLIFESIMNSNIEYKDVIYKFDIENQIINCNFSKYIDKNNIINVKIEVDKKTNKIININVNSLEDLTEKEFIIKYSDEYNNFKKALKMFNEKITEHIYNNDDFEEVSNSNPIKLFNEVLNDNNIEHSKTIKFNNTIFTIHKITSEKNDNIIVISFNIKNDFDSSNVITYLANAYAKSNQENLTGFIIKIDLLDPSTKNIVKTITDSELKEINYNLYINLKKLILIVNKEDKNNILN